MMDLIQWGLNNSVSLLLGIVGIGVLIGIHEFGHFVMCKLCGIATPTFAIGFGPTLLSRTFGATQFTLRAIPLGGYVEIAGLAEPGQGEQEEAYRSDAHAFTQKPLYQKLLVALGGIIFNILFSILIFTGILYIGAPQTRLLYPSNADTRIERVSNEVAETTPLQAGDTITHIDAQPIESGKAIFIQAQNTPVNDKINVTYRRNDASYTTQLTPKDIQTGGILFEQTSLQFPSLPQAAYKACVLSYMICAQVYRALSQLITQQQTQGLGGPVRIIAESMETARHGIGIFLLFLGFLSVNLAALNLLPVPVLDGGHIVYLAIEGITGRTVPQYIRGYIDYVFAALLLVGILIMSFFDVWRLFGGS